jgi:hypothetical protein
MKHPMELHVQFEETRVGLLHRKPANLLMKLSSIVIIVMGRLGDCTELSYGVNKASLSVRRTITIFLSHISSHSCSSCSKWVFESRKASIFCFCIFILFSISSILHLVQSLGAWLLRHMSKCRRGRTILE